MGIRRQALEFGGQGGKRRSAASGGKSEALSRQRRDWRARRSAGIALPQRWTSPHGLGVPKGIFSSTKRISPLILRRGVRRKRRRAGAARGRVVDLGTATRERGGKAGYAENMSRAAAVNAQRERVLLFLFLPFAIPFRRRGSGTSKRVKSDYRR